MKPTSASTLVLFTIIISVLVYAVLVDNSELERFPHKCRSVLQIEIKGLESDTILTEDRLK